MELAGSSARFWAALLVLLADLVWCVLVRFLLERGSCWVGLTIIAFGLLNFRRCCALH